MADDPVDVAAIVKATLAQVLSEANAQPAPQPQPQAPPAYAQPATLGGGYPMAYPTTQPPPQYQPAGADAPDIGVSGALAMSERDVNDFVANWACENDGDPNNLFSIQNAPAWKLLAKRSQFAARQQGLYLDCRTGAWKTRR